MQYSESSIIMIIINLYHHVLVHARSCMRVRVCLCLCLCLGMREREREKEREREGFIRNNVRNGVVSGAVQEEAAAAMLKAQQEAQVILCTTRSLIKSNQFRG